MKSYVLVAIFALFATFTAGLGMSVASAQSVGQCASCDSIWEACFYPCGPEFESSCVAPCFQQRFICRQLYC